MSSINKIKYDENDYRSFMPKTSVDANKYTRGVCNVFAGSAHYPGASVLCCLSAQTAGAGYVCLFTSREIKSQIAVQYPSIVTKSLEALCQFDIKKADYKHSSFIVGPGLSPFSSNNKNIVKMLCRYAKNPLLIDGSALAEVCNPKIQNEIKKRSERGRKAILTPHYGEAAKIVKSIKKDFNFSGKGHIAKMAYLISNKLKCICVLKGPNTVICNRRDIHVYTAATQVLSVAGSGDVLAGVIGSILSTKNIDPFSACALGVHIHALAGLLAAHDLSDLSVNAEKILEYIPDAIDHISQNQE